MCGLYHVQSLRSIHARTNKGSVGGNHKNNLASRPVQQEAVIIVRSSCASAALAQLYPDTDLKLGETGRFACFACMSVSVYNSALLSVRPFMITIMVNLPVLG